MAATKARTRAEKEASVVKWNPVKLSDELWWCYKHRSWSTEIMEKVGREIPNPYEDGNSPFPESFMTEEFWHSFPLEKYQRGRNDRPSHWFKAADLEEHMLHKKAGENVAECSECGRWWPDAASATACYDKHQEG